MPIQVTCPSCHTRFKVSERFAGQQGACPKCKETITVPELEDEVIIHEQPSEVGAVDARGRSVLKPIARKETKFDPIIFTCVAGAILIALLVAIVLRGSESLLPRIVGAIVLGPPLAWAGYTFLRDQELEPYRGAALWIRATACGIVYALLWGVYWYIGHFWFGDEAIQAGLSAVEIGIPAAIVIGLGTFCAYVCFDLDPGAGFFHFALYLLVTVLLRLANGLPAVAGL